MPVLLAIALLPTCRADSTLQIAAPHGGPITASARLDFRITVLPSLALSMHATGARIQGNSGALTLQRDVRDNADDAAPAGSAQLRPRRQVIDTVVRAPASGRSSLVTVASP